MPREYHDNFPEFYTIKEIIIDGAKRGGDKRQFIFINRSKEEEEKSFMQVYEDECALGTFLRSKGITNEQKIAIISENCYEWNVVFYAVAVNGSVCVPLDTGLSQEEIAKQLANCGCEVIFCSKKQKDKVLFAQQQEGVMLRHIFVMEEIEEYLEEGKKADKKYFDEYMSAPVSPEDLACIVYTSGTTGKTKGVMLSNKNICSDVNALLHANTGSHGIGFLPLNHTYSWVTGLFATLLVSEWGYICTNLRHLYDDIKKYEPTQFASVPLAVEMIYKNIIVTAKRNGTYDKLMTGIETSRNFMLSGYDARHEMFSEIHEKLGGKLECILCGGAYLAPEIEEFMHDIGIQIITGYGLTECSPTVTCSRRYDYKIGSVGLPLECNEISIHDPDENGIGEIYVRGDNVMMGYYNDEESTKAAFDGDWFKTGDYGYIDDDGFLFFTGRKKNLIILSNGKNVSPEEIESELMATIDYVKEVIVYEENKKIVGEFFLDEKKDEDVRALLKDDVEKVNKKLADFKRIQSIKIRDEEFPKTTSLKIKRHLAKEPATV